MSAGETGHGPDELTEARVRLAESLRASGEAGPAASAAFLAVPRHLFLPGESPDQAYEDTAITIRSDADGLPVSASSQPRMMAIMLEQLRLAPGQHVLEIGTGSGYNAALIAHIVGPSGSVTTIDVQPDLIQQARANLAAAGFKHVTVVCGDGADGVPAQAPYDRIMVTAGVWDLTPPWLAQLAVGGRLVAPIAVRGIQLSVAFERTETHWAGRSARRCSFIRMTGASAGPEAFVPLGPRPGLHALAVDGPPPRPGPLYEALSAGPAIASPASGMRAGDIGELADLDLWLALTEPDLSRVNLFGRHEGRAHPDQRRTAGLMPLGGFARYDGVGRLGLATLAVPAEPVHGDSSFDVVVHGYGPGGGDLAHHLAQRAAAWDDLGRPSAETLELNAYPAGADPAADRLAGTACAGPSGLRPPVSEDRLIIKRPHTTLVARWPTPPW